MIMIICFDFRLVLRYCAVLLICAKILLFAVIVEPNGSFISLLCSVEPFYYCCCYYCYYSELMICFRRFQLTAQLSACALPLFLLLTLFFVLNLFVTVLNSVGLILISYLPKYSSDTISMYVLILCSLHSCTTIPH